MARTSRNGAPAAASVDALDNLDLDDMFADDGDALFDGLDLDLGNMDDLQGASSDPLDKKNEPLHPLDPAEPSSPAGSDAVEPEKEESSTGRTSKRRKTKRKLKAPAHFHDEDDDDYVEQPKKKKKKVVTRSSTIATKAKTRGSKGAAKGAASKAKDKDTEKEKEKEKEKDKEKEKEKEEEEEVEKPPKEVKATTHAKVEEQAKAPPVASAEKPPSKVPPLSTSKVKGKARTSVTMPPPVSRSGVVAAAGQFGGRQAKRSSAYQLPKAGKAKIGSHRPLPTVLSSSAAAAAATTANSLLPPEKPPAAAAAKTEESTPKTPKEKGTKEKEHQEKETTKKAPPKPKVTPITIAQIQATHPGLTQSPFCGLLPSNTLFYPFMPALPAEPSFKHRKIFAIIDRIHTSFMNHLNATGQIEKGVDPATELQPIFQLLQEAFKDEKPDVSTAEKAKTIGNAVGSCRKAIKQAERLKLAGDLLAVCAMFKRQHDFLKQNIANMEQWCKSHFSEADYASVYVPNKSKKRRASEASLCPESVLSSFSVAQLKVKVICTAFKEPKSGALIAVLPSHAAAAAAQAAVETKLIPKSKKRKTELSIKGSISSSSAVGVKVPPSPKPAPTYVRMAASRRRENISQLISQTAAELEAILHRKTKEQQRGIDLQQRELKKLLEDEKVQVAHTTGMWQWLEKSGHFDQLTDEGVRWRLEDVDIHIPETPLITPQSGSDPAAESRQSNNLPSQGGSIVERLQSLLVHESDVEDDEDEDYEELYGDYDFDGSDDDDSTCSATSLLDLSDLRPDERASLQLRSIKILNGLTEPKSFTRNVTSPTKESPSKTHLVSATKDSPSKTSADKANTSVVVGTGAVEPENELDEVIDAMIDDLRDINKLNRKRAGHLEATVKAQVGREGNPNTRAEEATLIVKCQQLLKKAKEIRVKNGKAKATTKDELALPW